jgi:hypothetical protein
MKELLYFRIGLTALSHDELLLFDVLFKYRVQLRSLRREHFVETFNCRHHNLDDSELQLAIERMRDRGLVEIVCHNDVNYVSLTQAGGELWSRERCPVWERYASEHYRETLSGKPFMTVVATSASTLDEFLRFAPNAGLNFENARIRRFEISRHQLIPWHPFTRLYVAIAMNFESSQSIDSRNWQQHRVAHEERRTWWRNVVELQKFWPQTE